MPEDHAESEVWLARAAAGDKSARTKLLELHRARLRRMVAVRLDRRLLQRIDPSDIIQETLILDGESSVTHPTGHSTSHSAVKVR